MDDLTGQRIGRFEILRRIGAGGMGEVWEARDTQLHRRVALKRLSPSAAADAEARRRLLREARNSARVPHRGVAALHDLIEHDGELWLVMELVHGRTLESMEKPLPVNEILDLAVQAAAALEAAHGRGVVHGDIKPANLIVEEDGTLKLLDFGVAGLLAQAQAEAPTTMGRGHDPGSSGFTPAYAAPEVLRNEASDHRADLFSLGLVLFEACSGRHPFAGKSSLDKVSRILSEPAPYLRRDNAGSPPGLERIVSRLLAKSPEDRYPDAGALKHDLETLRAARATETTAAPTVRRWVPAMGLLALVAVLAVWLGPWGPLTDRGPDAVRADFDASDWVIGVWADSGREPVGELAAIGQGLASTITARLARLSREHDLQVVPTSSLREEGVESLDEARRRLGITLAVNVAARQMGEQLRVTTSLVNVPEHRQIFADIVNGSPADLMELEERVASSVLRMLRVELRPAEGSVAGVGTEVTEAYNAYLRGQGYLSEFHDEVKLGAAIELFQRALQADPDYAAAHAALGRAYVNQFRLTEEPEWIRRAAQECRRAIELDDLLAEAHVCMGTVYEFRGEPDEAADSFARATSLDPTSDTAFIGLADAYATQDRTDLAEETYRQAISMRPHYWAGYHRLGRFLLRRGHIDEAIDAFRTVVELAPDSFVGYRDLGVAHYLADRWDEARSQFERALEIHPRDRRALSNLGTLHFYEARYAEAARIFERAVELNDQDPLMWGNLGDAYYWAPGERAAAEAAYARAIELCRRQLQLNPRDPLLLADLAYYLAMTGEGQEALTHLQRALDQSPDDILVRSTAAKVHSRLGDAAAALEFLETAIDAGYSRDEVRAEPLFRDLGDEPRFKALVDRADADAR